MDNVGQMVPVITEIITFSLQEYLPQSPAGRQRGISALFFAQEEKYAALISAQEFGTLRKYQSAPPRAGEMEDKHMLR